MNNRVQYQIVERYGKMYNAGDKAPNDVARILKDQGFKEYPIRRFIFKGSLGKFWGGIVWIAQWFWYRLRLPRNSVLFIQYPGVFLSGRLSRRLITRNVKESRNMKIITLVHDLQWLREGRGWDVESGRREKGIEFLKEVPDVVIVHNQRMCDYLKLLGLENSRLVNLDVFDYLTNHNAETMSEDPHDGVIVAGNLHVGKAGYIKYLSQINGVNWKLYGPNFDANTIGGPCVEYMGCFPPDELQFHLKGSFGLVWDGDSIDSCSDGMGKYLEINSPHKLSLYLASGIPVITCGNAAIANFVMSNGVGIVLSSLRGLPMRLHEMNREEYSRLRNNARKMATKLRYGYFTKRAIETSLRKLDVRVSDV